MQLRSTQAGFTLLEMMLVIGIAALILGIGVPNLRQFMLNNRMTGTANDLLIAAHTARTEAIKRHVQTVVCFSSNPTANAPVCDGDGSQGWVVFVDDADPEVAAATDNNVEVDANEEILLRHGPMHETLSVNTMPAAHASYIAYNPAGFSREVLGVDTGIASVVVCDTRGNNALHGPAFSTARAFSISETGRPSITRVVADITALGDCP